VVSRLARAVANLVLLIPCSASRHNGVGISYLAASVLLIPRSWVRAAKARAPHLANSDPGDLRARPVEIAHDSAKYARAEPEARAAESRGRVMHHPDSIPRHERITGVRRCQSERIIPGTGPSRASAE